MSENEAQQGPTPSMAIIAELNATISEHKNRIAILLDEVQELKTKMQQRESDLGDVRSRLSREKVEHAYLCTMYNELLEKIM